MNIRQMSFGVLLSSAFMMPANATDVTLVNHASVNALVSGFEDLFQEFTPYQDVFISLTPKEGGSDLCFGNHPNLEWIWIFSDAQSSETFNTDMVYSLLNMAWITKSEISLIGNATPASTLCSQEDVRYVVIHKDVI